MSTADTVAGRPDGPSAPGREPLARRVADAVLAHRDVVRLSGGPFGTIATYLPGRRLLGVSLGGDGDPARVAVVVRLGAGVPATAEAVRAIVATEAGVSRVDVTVTDLDLPDDAADPAGRRERP